MYSGLTQPVEYLGHVVSKKGTADSKVETVLKARAPFLDWFITMASSCTSCIRNIAAFEYLVKKECDLHVKTLLNLPRNSWQKLWYCAIMTQNCHAEMPQHMEWERFPHMYWLMDQMHCLYISINFRECATTCMRVNFFYVASSLLVSKNVIDVIAFVLLWSHVWAGYSLLGTLFCSIFERVVSLLVQ